VAVGELDAAEYRFALADAAYQSAEISLERAESNLEYTEIRAPIDGVVIARNVEVGQTVAASLSAPVLFVLAHDLEQMEILASVDESDIGQIAAGQEVHFSVQAYPNRNFEGTVRQVRLQAKTQENVVTYSVVVAVGNENGELLPGMTATLGIVIDKAEDILAVPNTALRFRATDEMQEAVAMTGDTAQSRSAAATGTRARPETGEQRPERAAGATAGSGGVGTLWYLDEAGGLRATRVRTGLSDGVQTVIVSAPEGVLHEGLPVIAAVTTASAPSTTDNPFQAPRQGQGGPGQRPGGF
jgi:HlyD family secretion protein